MLFGHGRNTLTAANFPQGCDILRLHDGGCRWSLLNPSRGVYNWAKLDAHLAASEAKGIPSMYVFCSTPAWAALAPVDGFASIMGGMTNCPPNLTYLDEFTAALMTRYKGRIKVLEPWNEANWKGFWNGTYAQLLGVAKTIWQRAKSIDPTIQITTTNVCLDDTSVDKEMATLFDLGFQQYADIASFHGYLPNGASALDIAPVLDRLHAVLDKYGLKIPLWDTESGFKSPTLVPDSAKRQWVRDWLTVRLQHGIDAAIWYQWDNTTHGQMGLPTGTLTIAGQAWMDAYKSVHPMPAVTGLAQAG